MIEGVAAPESTNNAAAQTSLIPMLTLGIPSNAVMAMMIGGMMIHGIVPGPQVMEQKPGLFSDLFDGIGFVPLVMGVFGIAEIMAILTNTERRDLVSSKVSGLMPTKEDLKRSIAPILRGTALGGLLGILPGGGAVLASFSAYTVEKRLSKTPEKFGTGMIEGVAAPESANNAAAQTSFIPMLTLGIPSNAVMAMMIGGMMIHGIVPGPQVMEQKPGLFWGMIVSMWLSGWTRTMSYTAGGAF